MYVGSNSNLKCTLRTVFEGQFTLHRWINTSTASGPRITQNDPTYVE